jgi:hypothetical protein
VLYSRPKSTALDRYHLANRMTGRAFDRSSWVELGREKRRCTPPKSASDMFPIIPIMQRSDEL